MPAAIHPKNLFIVRFLPRIVSTEEIDAGKLAAFCRGLGNVSGIGEKQSCCLMCKEFRFSTLPGQSHKAIAQERC
jgi:hypothetical protein